MSSREGINNYGIVDGPFCLFNLKCCGSQLRWTHHFQIFEFPLHESEFVASKKKRVYRACGCLSRDGRCPAFIVLEFQSDFQSYEEEIFLHISRIRFLRFCGTTEIESPVAMTNDGIESIEASLPDENTLLIEVLVIRSFITSSYVFFFIFVVYESERAMCCRMREASVAKLCSQNSVRPMPHSHAPRKRSASANKLWMSEEDQLRWSTSKGSIDSVLCLLSSRDR